MKKMTAAILSATMALSMGAALPQGLYETKTVVIAAGETKFDEKEFFVVVGNYGAEDLTQLRYFVQKADGSFSAEKIVWENAPEGLKYGDVLTAEEKFSLEKVYPANDPVNAMAYYYKLSNDAKLNKVGNCGTLMEQKDLTVKSVDYDGSSHWSVRYTDESGEKEYYYGLSTFASSLGVNPIEGGAGDVYTFAMLNGNVVIPLVKKNVEEEMPTYKIVKLPDKLEYKTGEHIDLKGIQIEVTKGDEEPVVYTYPDVAFDYQSNVPKSPTVVLSTNFRNDEAGTYSVKVAGTGVGFNVKVVDDQTDVVIKDLAVFEEGEQMKLKDVVELSKKGNDLCWADFVKYKGVDVGSGLFILEYNLGNGYMLHVGGTLPTLDKSPEAIMYALLSRNEKSIDIRTDDVEAFIAEIDSENDPTALKGTKEMTLYDVRKFALIGDSLDWSNFEDYKGRDVGSGQNVWEFKLPKGFVLHVCGITDEKPSLIELSRDGEKGIDIRKDDVSAYIASKEMTLDDVIELSKKGDALDWSDFEDFKCHDSSTCIRNWSFDLGDGFELEVGGPEDGKPDFILLNYYSRVNCDIRTENVEAFIASQTADPTVLKGTKEMTLYDVRKFALIGDSLDWSNFEDYKGRDVGSGQNVWEFKLPKGFVLHVCGITDEKPSLIELSRDGEKGIDIRKDDVSAYIASKEMTLDDVIELSKKGDALDWSDFEDFKCHDSSTCIRNWSFDLGDGFELEVGGPEDGKPDFILLDYYSRSYCDIRTENVEAFIDDITTRYIIVKGDANFDHRMDMADVVFVMQCLANPDKYRFTEQGRINADMNGNGITVADAQTIQLMLLGYDVPDVFSAERSAIANNTFVYEKEGAGGDCNIKFNEDGTFLFSPGYLSSYLGGGTWKISGKRVILTQENDGLSGKRINCFRIAGNDLIYIEEDSDNFYGITVKNGEKFSLASEKAETAIQLSDIVSIKTPYNPAMSDWSGIGILLEVDSPDYPITLKAADGHFTEWDIKKGSGPVKSVGKTYDIGKNGYIFWTPDDLNYKDGFNSEITVMGVSGEVYTDLGKIYITKAEGNSLTASFEKPAAATDSAKLLGLKESKIKSVNVTSLPKGYDFTFTDEKAQKVIDFLSGIELITNFTEDPGQLDGMTWVIKLEYENDEAMTLYDIGGFIRSESNSWFKYEYDYDSPLNTLIWELSK